MNLNRPGLIHPFLATSFAELDRAGVRWCLLRGEGELDRTGGDVDLLVAEDDVATADALLDQLNYVRLAAWGRGSHRFYLTYDAQHDAWIKLDIVSRLSFGPHSMMETGAAEACLARRKSVDGISLLADRDRFWAILLHCLLDREDIPERHATSLRVLSRSITPDGPLANWFATHAPHPWNPARALSAARDADWQSLVDMGRQMRSARPSRPGLSLVRRAGRASARRMTKLRTLILEPGLTMALLGPDGAGKSTLARELARTFYFPVRSVYMGLYGAGTAVGRPPNGALEHVGRIMGHLGRQWTGYVRGLYHRSRGRLVVYDRFGYDALLRQPRSTWIGSRARRWLLSHAVPAPDLVLLLDAPPELLRSRKAEHDLASLDIQRRSYLDLASRMGNITTVRGDQSQDAVRRDATELIWQRYVDRRRRRATKR